jgi:hypothetical protein
MNWLLRRRFLTLLLALLMLLVAYPLLRKAYDTRLPLDALFTAVILAALLVVFPRKRSRVVALLLGLPPLVGLLTHYVLQAVPRLPLAVGFHTVATVFLAFCVATLLREIYRQGTVSADSIFGAFCGYLLVGLIFSRLYCIIEWVEPDSFQANEAIMPRLHHEDRRFFLLTYFSFMTLTTVGYGDVTPVAENVRGWPSSKPSWDSYTLPYSLPNSTENGSPRCSAARAQTEALTAREPIRPHAFRWITHDGVRTNSASRPGG